MITPLNRNILGPPQKVARPDKSAEQTTRIQFIQPTAPEAGQDDRPNRTNLIPLHPRRISFIEDLLGDG